MTDSDAYLKEVAEAVNLTSILRREMFKAPADINYLYVAQVAEALRDSATYLNKARERLQ